MLQTSANKASKETEAGTSGGFLNMPQLLCAAYHGKP